MAEPGEPRDEGSFPPATRDKEDSMAEPQASETHEGGAVREPIETPTDVPAPRKFVRKRGVALVLTFVALALGGIATALLVFGQPLGIAISKAISLGSAFSVVWTIVRWALTVLVVMTLFAVFYYLGPNRKAP